MQGFYIQMNCTNSGLLYSYTVAMPYNEHVYTVTQCLHKLASDVYHSAYWDQSLQTFMQL